MSTPSTKLATGVVIAILLSAFTVSDAVEGFAPDAAVTSAQPAPTTRPRGTLIFPQQESSGLLDGSPVNGFLFANVKLDPGQATMIRTLAVQFAATRSSVLRDGHTSPAALSAAKRAVLPQVEDELRAYELVLNPRQRDVFLRNSQRVVAAWLADTLRVYTGSPKGSSK